MYELTHVIKGKKYIFTICGRSSEFVKRGGNKAKTFERASHYNNEDQVSVAS